MFSFGSSLVLSSAAFVDASNNVTARHERPFKITKLFIVTAYILKKVYTEELVSVI